MQEIEDWPNQWQMNSKTSMNDGAAGEIRTPEVRHHRISNPAQWPGYATAAVSLAKLDVVMNMTVIILSFNSATKVRNNLTILAELLTLKPVEGTYSQDNTKI